MLPPIDESIVIQREVTVYACGCSSERVERVERIYQPTAANDLCRGHGERVRKVIRSVEYVNAEDDGELAEIQGKR